ncbi:hypothetical protein CEXT_729221, partial [Caerostris extrusa]
MYLELENETIPWKRKVRFAFPSSKGG